MYDYEYEDEILIFLRFMKFLHIYEPEALKLLIKEHPKVDEDEIYMILDELLWTFFDDAGPYEDDEMTTVRFSDERIDRLYELGCKGCQSLREIRAWQEKIEDIFLFYVVGASYSVFDVAYHFSASHVTIDITLSPDCYDPAPFLNSVINMILHCQQELRHMEDAAKKIRVLQKRRPHNGVETLRTAERYDPPNFIQSECDHRAGTHSRRRCKLPGD